MDAVSGYGNGEYHCVVCERLSKMRNGEFEPIYSEAISGITEVGASVNVDDEADSHSVVGVGVDDLISKVEMASTEEPEENVEESCKICSLGKLDDNNVLIKCTNVDCAFKFYHMDCLSPSLRSAPPPDQWYCPACICRVCFLNERDECVILCDGCDEGYHYDCLTPPLDHVPEGDWYCPNCQPPKRAQRRKPKKNASRKTKKI